MRWVLLLLMVGLAFGCSRGGPSPDVAAPISSNEGDLTVVDEYLEAWSLLARMSTAEDAKTMAGELKKREPAFEDALSRLIDKRDPRAAGRLVYSQVIQIGAFLDLDSKLGVAVSNWLGDTAPVTSLDGDRVVFAGDLYLWWRRNSASYQPYRVLEDWERSVIARETVIPMFLKHAGNTGPMPSSIPSKTDDVFRQAAGADGP